MNDPKDIIKSAKQIVEDYLKQKGVPETPEPIVTMIAVVLASIKQVYAVDWPKALDFFDRMCFQYCGNITAAEAMKILSKPEDSGSSSNVVDFSSFKKESLN